MGHLSFCKTSRRSLLPAAHCGILIPVLSGSVFRSHHVSARWEKERLSHCPSQAAWQSCALASNSKYQTPLFPGPQENRWVTRRQLQKMFSRLCLSNGLKKERKKKKKTSYSSLFNNEQFLQGALSQQRRWSGSSRCTL